jgi:hypothetical protein
MPNHVINILTLEGPLSRVKEIFRAISPGPSQEELATEVDSPTEPGGPLFKPATKANLAKRREGRYEIDFEKIIPMPKNIYRGDVGSREEEIYGRDNWYHWNTNNWGTKWNAYDMSKIDDYTMTFNTAWAMPERVIKALSKMFPDVVVKIKWADEDIGSNCGEIHYRNGGEIFEDTPEDRSKEAYELAFEINGGGEYYTYDKDKGTYIYKENESRVSIYQATADLKNIFERISDLNEAK